MNQEVSKTNIFSDTSTPQDQAFRAQPSVYPWNKSSTTNLYQHNCRIRDLIIISIPAIWFHSVEVRNGETFLVFNQIQKVIWEKNKQLQKYTILRKCRNSSIKNYILGFVSFAYGYVSEKYENHISYKIKRLKNLQQIQTHRKKEIPNKEQSNEN